MSLGIGTLATNQKKDPAGAPFPANSAYNGVSIDPNNGRVVLGDDGIGSGAADFVSDRFIDTKGFLFSMFGTQGEYYLQEALLGLRGAAAVGAFAEIRMEDVAQPQHIFNVFMDGNSAMGVIGYGDGVPRLSFIQVSATFVNIVRNQGTFPITQALFEVTEGAIATEEPTANGPGEWKLGKVVAAAVALDNTQYVEVMIDGNVVRLAVVT